jgi:poly-gamma-glutamate capsule biosynthesis protein CapA/YwtB (metallophosphatase superfamily)
LPTIQERDSESDLKEELDRKEREYQKKIVRLQGEVESLRLVHEQVTASHAEMTRKMVKKNASDMIKDRDETIRQLELQLTDREDEADSLYIRNQLVMEMMKQGGVVTIADLEKHIEMY